VLFDLQNAELRILPESAVASMQGPRTPYLGEGAPAFRIPVDLALV